MKRIMTIAVSLMVCLALAAGTASAGTLYDQEGTADDGTPSIDASGQGPAGDDSDNWTNWKYQYGNGSWSGVYAAGDGWLVADDTGDMGLEVEADVEMYFTQSVSNNKIYFHLGNIYEATSDDLTAYVDGSFSSNNGQYIGISFDGTSKTEASFEEDENGLTGVILGGMQSDRDTWREQDEQMDLEILLSWGDGWKAPGNYGEGAHGTVTKTLWWLVDGGNAGTYDYQWRVRLMPEADQPDGDYYLDPAVVSAPVL
ncbi:MAG: hypothetical protein R6X33_04120 [Candidatus Brocadiia bacterium]